MTSMDPDVRTEYEITQRVHQLRAIARKIHQRRFQEITPGELDRISILKEEIRQLREGNGPTYDRV